jgi:hypothetical protein
MALASPFRLLIYMLEYSELTQADLLKALLFLQIYEMLTVNENFRKIERRLDDSETFNFYELITHDKESFDEYLKFFETIVVMKIPNRFSKEEAELLFGRPSELLNRHYEVRKYIANNYRNLDTVLALNSKEK